MTLEGLGWSKLTKLVADHGVVHEHWNVLATVVNGEGVSNEVWENGGTAGPGLDDLLGALFVLSVDLVEEVLIDERALL